MPISIEEGSGGGCGAILKVYVGVLLALVERVL
jgi:hypothetical protein